MTVEPTHPLLIASERYKERSCQDYVQYCSAVRAEVWNTSDKAEISGPDRAFLNKTFANEMEPLAKICQDYFGSQTVGIKVAHIDEPLADGKILVPGKAPIFVEFTASKDFRRIEEAYAQLNKGIHVSLTGPKITESEITALRTGAGNEIDGEFEDEFVERIEIAVKEVLDKKLKKKWPSRNNWLCVVLDDQTNWWGDLVGELLENIVTEYRPRLKENSIAMLWFLGYEHWISSHRV